MLKDLQIDKALLILIAYLTLLSVCYNNGYWSVFSINAFNYYGVQDILKGIAAPFFQFGGLIFLPIVTSAIILLVSYKSKQIEKDDKKEKKQTEEDGSKKEQMINLCYIEQLYTY